MHFKHFICYLGLLLASCGSQDETKKTSELQMNAYRKFLSKNYDDAIHDYSVLIQRDSMNGSYFYNRGFSYFAKKKYTNAAPDFLRSADLSYKLADCYYYAGLSKSFLGDSSGLFLVKRAYDLDSTDPYYKDAYFQLMEEHKNRVDFSSLKKKQVDQESP